MAVLKGEGRVPILFGSWALPLPPNRSAYIARPDLGGEYTSVVIAHDSEGVTPGVKAVARHLARHGASIVVPELGRGRDTAEGFEWAVSDLADAVESVRLPGTEWASPSRIAMLGVGDGGLAAAIVAAEEKLPLLVLIGTPLDGVLLGEVEGARLVLIGAEAGEDLDALRAEVDGGEWVVYRGVGSAFLDEGSESFDPGAAADALDRIVAKLDLMAGTVDA